jgi:hypothetical protein
VRQQALADREARKALRLQHHDVPAAPLQQRAGNRPGRAGADHDHIVSFH